MDYFSKLKKRMATPKAQPTSAAQLAKFNKCWNYVHNFFIVEDKKTSMRVSQTDIPQRLRQMVDLLVDEEGRLDDNSTGVCMEYFLKNGVLSVLVNISEGDYPLGIRGETIRTVASMINLLDDTRFLVHNAVHKPTVKLLRTCVLDERQSEMYHEDLVDLMYTICSKIHGYPALLNIFFHDKQWLITPQKAHPSQQSAAAAVLAANRPAPIPEEGVEQERVEAASTEATGAEATSAEPAYAEATASEPAFAETIGAEATVAGVEAIVAEATVREATVAGIIGAEAEATGTEPVGMEVEATTAAVTPVDNVEPTTTGAIEATTAETVEAPTTLTIETITTIEAADAMDTTEQTEPVTPSTPSAPSTPSVLDPLGVQPYYAPKLKKIEIKKPEYEFLLFTYLLRFVHREGRAGDYARTGLLFIMEMTDVRNGQINGQLGDFILDSDFATIMAAGLGALYSQLPRKLVVKDEMELNSNSSAYLLGFDMDPRALPHGVGVEVSSSPDFKYQLDSFLKLLEFCQDVLTRCPNVEISVALLQNIRTIFLENILYPSILECSDTDGSSVAVISYVDLILQTLQQDELVDVVVGFLMETDEDEPAPTPRTERQSTLFGGGGGGSSNGGGDNWRQSNMFVGLVEDAIKSSPYFTTVGRFNLKDLIFSRLKSSSQPTVVATLKLLHTLITRHCRYSLQLLQIEVDEKATNFPRRPPEPIQPGITAPSSQDPDPVLSASSSSSTSSKATTISHHLRELELFFSLISAIDESHSEETLNIGYETYLRDAEATLEADWCYQNAALVEWRTAAMPNSSKPDSRTKRMSRVEKRKSFKYGQRFDEINAFADEANLPTTPNPPAPTPKLLIPRHRVRPTDPLLQILLGLLSHFFAQSSELNLALTGVISALAVCPYRSLEGWLAFRESDRADPDELLVLENMGNTGGSTPGQGHAVRPAIPVPVRENAKKGKIRANDIYAHFEPDRDPVNEDDDDDDRSIDFATDRNSINMTAATTFKSFPPFFTLFRTLTQQVDYYRSEVDSFDHFLQERRKGLFYGEAALVEPRISLSSSLSSSTRRNKTPAAQAPGAASLAPPKSDLVSGGLFSTRRSTAPRPSISASPRIDPVRSNSISTSNLPTMSMTLTTASSGATLIGVPVPSPSTSLVSPAREPLALSPQSPLSVHARKTQNIRIQPLFPSNFVTEPEEQILNLDEDDEDTFAPKTTPSRPKRVDKSTEISLSNILNNVVILEEAIKELVALVQVRRSLGIDEVLFA
ncbi:Retinoic acid induced 16-like protein-domain-containing protein [Endogone sp. FLAS-F59071]|nr:Retinoic acid induced 16-like protein-domain-containing protein [Endogone sp. FLAS-F59071]|eukprot:RUS17204.1 Retinoic acid induced 16-like protein-domain-containing protein [Endogone sp. FLAS-F59071]